MKKNKLMVLLSSVAALALIGIIATSVLLLQPSNVADQSGTKDQDTTNGSFDENQRLQGLIDEESANANDDSQVFTDIDGDGLPDTASKYKSNFISVKNKVIHYTDAGVKKAQSIINKKPKSEAATWGGVAKLSVKDNKNTHIIAHNPGAFNVLTKLKKGDKITVVDSKKKKRTYKVRVITKVDDDGYELKTKKDYWYVITGTGGGERITLQTCLSRTTNLLVIAY